MSFLLIAALALSPADYVDVFVGTEATGHTTPAAAYPFGLVQAGPDTGNFSWDYTSGYRYADTSLYGFSQTHLNGTGCHDLGDLLILPYSGEKPAGAVPFLKDTEMAEPGYYSVTLSDGIRCEIAAAEHSAVYRFEFPEEGDCRLKIDYDWGIIPADESLEKRVFERRIAADGLSGTLKVKRWVTREVSFVIETNLIDRTMEVRLALSANGSEKARHNLEAEVKDRSFDEVRLAARAKWNEYLSRMRVAEDAADDAKKNFYTALYHLFFQPNNIADAGETPSFSTFSCWDTFRAAHPLYTLLTPELVPHMIDSLLAQGKKTGYLPIWSLWGEENQCMIGTHSIPMIADYYLNLKDATKEECEQVFDRIKDTLVNRHEGRELEDRELLDRYGYYPCDLVKWETVSRLLEGSYDDWCAAALAKKLGRSEDAEYFSRRAEMWRNVYEPASGLPRGRKADGSWRAPFDPDRIESRWQLDECDFTEGSSRQYAWHVLQNPEGLIQAMGGRDKAMARLDEFFSHESAESSAVVDVTGLIGAYAHGNEPSHHAIYLYQYLKRPDRVAELVREVFNRFYAPKPDGLCGNDDCGQMSAWYLFSAAGLYPFNPASGEYVLGAPQVPRVELNSFTIVARNLSKERKYVKSVSLNGRPLEGFKLAREEVMKGGELVFEMCDEIELLASKFAAVEADGDGADVAGFRPFEFDLKKAEDLTARQTADGSWSDVVYADDSLCAWKPSCMHLRERTLFLARMYNRTKNVEFADTAKKALDWWVKAKLKCRNWWWNEIGAPQDFGVAAVLIDPILTAGDRERYAHYLERSQIKMTGQNRVWLSRIVMMRGILRRDAALIDAAVKAIADEVKASDGEEGIAKDWSFRQHGLQLQFGNYGASYLINMARLSKTFSGTRWELPADKREILRNLAERGFRWTLWKNNLDFSCLGRQILPNAQCDKAKAIEHALGLIEDAEGESAGESPKGFAVYPESAYAVYRTGEWMASVKWCSPKTLETETWCNGENTLGGHLCDGALFVYSSGDEYRDIAPLWKNWRLIPGVTSYRDLPPVHRSWPKHGANEVDDAIWSGDERESALEFTLRRDGLSVHKRWMFSPDEIVCTGEGISSTNVASPVVTCVEHATAHPEARVLGYADGKLTVENGPLLYDVYAPESAISVRIEDRDGDWDGISPVSVGNRFSGRVIEIYINHGVAPVDASYRYVIRRRKTIERDLVIYGSSPAALTAAIEAKNLGKSVVIVSPETRIGGLTTGGLGQTDIGNKQAFGGLALQFYRDVAAYYRDEANWKYQCREEYLPDGQCAGSKGEDSMWTFEPSAALKILERWEKRYSLDIHRGELLDRSPCGVKTAGDGEQRRVVSFKTLSGDEFIGKMFIDATYEGDLMAAAGVSYTVGREANSTYGETVNGIERRFATHHQFNDGVDPYVVKGEPRSGLLPTIEPYDPSERDGNGDRRVQAYCFRMCLTDCEENRIPFKRPADYDERNYELLLRNLEAYSAENFTKYAKEPWQFLPWVNSHMPNRKTDTNNRTGFSTDFVGGSWDWPEASYEERRRILVRHLSYQKGLVWTLANNPRVPAPIREEVAKWGTCKDEFTDGSGDGWQNQLYVREARRMIGEYVMTEHNCRGKVKATRPVAMGAYGMDSHNVRRRVDENGFVRNEGDVEDYSENYPGGEYRRFSPYPIDYGAIVPRRGECANLLVPVCLSASHMAFGSIRMEPAFFALGQSAGAAAALSIDSGCAVQDLDYRKLRERLLAGGQVIEL